MWQENISTRLQTSKTTKRKWKSEKKKQTKKSFLDGRLHKYRLQKANQNEDVRQESDLLTQQLQSTLLHSSSNHNSHLIGAEQNICKIVAEGRKLLETKPPEAGFARKQPTNSITYYTLK